MSHMPKSHVTCVHESCHTHTPTSWYLHTHKRTVSYCYYSRCHILAHTHECNHTHTHTHTHTHSIILSVLELSHFVTHTHVVTHTTHTRAQYHTVLAARAAHCQTQTRCWHTHSRHTHTRWHTHTHIYTYTHSIILLLLEMLHLVTHSRVQNTHTHTHSIILSLLQMPNLIRRSFRRVLPPPLTHTQPLPIVHTFDICRIQGGGGYPPLPLTLPAHFFLRILINALFGFFFNRGGGQWWGNVSPRRIASKPSKGNGHNS